MSSSSSIAAARRRRAGGPPGPTPPSSTSGRPSQNSSSNGQSSSTGPASPVNPLVLLQQHHIKINMLEQSIKELNLKQTTPTANTLPSQNNSNHPSSQPDLNINELSDLIMSKVEEQLDLKAFYENDENLMNEIETLKSIVQSQQLLINGLNTAVFSLISKLDVSIPNKSSDSDNDHDSDIVFASSIEEAKPIVAAKPDSIIPKSVFSNECDNTFTEFKNDFDLPSDSQENTNSFVREGLLQA